MQSTGTVWTTLLEVCPRIIQVKFDQNPYSGKGGDVFRSFEVDDAQHMMDEAQWTKDTGHWAPTISHLNIYVQVS